MNWIWNKKRYSSVLFLGGVCIQCLNLSILIFILDMFFRVCAAKNSSWYDVVTGETQESDRFFMEKSDMIFSTLAVVILLLFVFCGVVLWLFRRQQTEMGKRESGIFLVLGYSKQQVFWLLFADGILDTILALGIGSGIFSLAIRAVMHNEVFRSFYQVTADNRMTGILAGTVGVLFFVFVIAIQSFYWMNKAENKGICSMLKDQT